MNIHISCSSFITYQNQMILCTRISRVKTLLSLSEILVLWQHCRFQGLFKDFKECSVITSSHVVFKELCHQLVLDMNADGKSTHNVNFWSQQRTIEALLFWTKEAWDQRCCLGNYFLYMLNLVYIVP